MDKAKKRYDFLDLFKCIAMLMVVSLHTGLWNTNFMDNNTSNVFVQYCFRILCEGVPIFILINGFLLMDKDFNIKKHVIKILKIMLILCFWATLSYLLVNLFTKYEKITFQGIINNLLNIGPNNYYNGPLWFLQNLLMLYFIYPVINHLYKNEKKLFYYLFFVVSFFTFFDKILISINNIYSLNFIKNLMSFLNSFNPISNGVFIFYFMLGGVLYDKRNLLEKNKNKIMLIVVGVISYIISLLFTTFIFKFRNIPFVSNYLYGRISLVFIILAMFTITYNYKNKNRTYNKLVKSIGSNTMGIYLIHRPLSIILIYFINLSFADNFIKRCIWFLIVFVISYLLAIIIKKIPGFNKTIKI